MIHTKPASASGRLSAHKDIPIPGLRHGMVFFAILCALFAALSIAGARSESLVYDEPVHITEGKRAWQQRLFTVDVANPPLVRELAVIPILMAEKAGLHFPTPADMAFPGRLLIIILGCILLALVFRYALYRFGIIPALVAVFFLAFEPGMLAHSHYVTLDFGFTVFFFLSYILFEHFLITGRTSAAMAAGFATGWTLASKALGLPYIAASFTLLLFYLKRGIVLQFLRQHRSAVSLFILCTVLTVWSSYFFTFDSVIARSDRTGRVSDILYSRAVRTGNEFTIRGIELLRNVRMPLGTYLGMLKNSLIRASEQSSSVFFSGDFRPSEWYYMFYVILLKLPLPFMVAAVLGFSVNIINLRSKIIPVLIPVLVITAFTAVGKTQPWFRYILPLIPFLAILAGTAVYGTKKRIIITALSGLILWQAYGTAVQFPHFLSYANELAGPRDTRYRLLSDSNLDWGQSLISLKVYIDQYRPKTLYLSYFGVDDAAAYGFSSDTAFGSHKTGDICAFHRIDFPDGEGRMTAISVSNWYICRYYTDLTYHNPDTVIAESFLIYH